MIDIGIIGCGNMGFAIAKELSRNTTYRLHLYDADPSRLKAVCGELSLTPSTLETLLSAAQISIIAVKPQVLPSLYHRLSRAENMNWISIAAGVSLSSLSAGLNSDKVIRFMPNMAASIAASVTAMAVGAACTHSFVESAEQIASSFGTVYRIEEHLMSAFIGISGSGIASLFATFHHMAMAGVHQGLPYPTALSIVSQTAEGAAKMLAHSGEHPQSIITKVCSPGGTTIEAMKALEEEGFAAAVMNAVIAASEKARELEEIAKKREQNND